MRQLLIIFALHVLYLGTSYAVEPLAVDTTELPSSAVEWYSESQLANPAIAEPNYIDTTLKGFQKYDFAYRERSFFSHKGITGHASRNLIFNPASKGHGFSYMQNNIYEGYLFSHDNIKFYRPEFVFTDLYYVTGGEPEQLFYALHSQRLSENLVISFKYQLVRSPSVYSRIKANNANFYGSLDYVSDNKRYQLLGSFVWNRMINQESGGLRNHEGFEEQEERDSVWLYNAESRYRETEISLHQYYQLGYYRSNNENNGNGRFVNLGRIYHKSSYSRQSNMFDEPAIPHPYFPGHPNVDSTQTYDSTIVHNISNKIGYTNYRFGNIDTDFPLFFKVYLKHDYFKIYHPFGNKRDFSQFTQGLQINTDDRRLFSLNGFFNYTFGGYNDSDFSAGISGVIGNQRKNRNRLKMKASYYEMESPYLMSNFYSNYVIWDNNFDKAIITQTGVCFKSSAINIDLNLFHLDNWHYFGDDALPRQADESFFVASAALKANIALGSNTYDSYVVNNADFGFDNHIVYQHLSNDNYEQFPSLVSYHSLYADLVMFDKALYARIGLDASYNSPYYAQPYMPVYKQFYVQDDYQTNHYIFLDAFINAKIKRARLFVKYQNLGALIWNQPPIYTIPFYPLLENQLRFGISWMFYD